MVRSMTAAVSGLRAHQTKLDVIGNNIANVNTSGYKTARVVFRDAMYQTLSGSSSASAQYAGTDSKQIGYGSNVASITSIWTTGAYYPTDYGTDVMITGNGFFLVGPMEAAGHDPENCDSLYLTRVGEFDVKNGYLVDANGYYVYGFAPVYKLDANNNIEYDADGKPVFDLDTDGNPQYDTSRLIPIEVPKDAAGDYLTLKNILIGTDGSVSASDNKNNTVFLGQVAIAYVGNENGLESEGNSYYTSGLNAGGVKAYVPGEGSTGKLMAGGLEMSTVDLSQQFTDMITTQRGFQANSRIITVTDEMLQELVNLKR